MLSLVRMALRPGLPAVDGGWAMTMDDPENIDVATLQRDIAKLREDLMSLRDHVSEGVKQKTDEVRAAAEERIGELREELDRLTSGLQGQGRDAVAGLEQCIQGRPITSIAVAFGLGMILSRFFLGRR
jgi:ElaB/YqjD/DUF883 family membrane-anchored ribosome-binding protein